MTEHEDGGASIVPGEVVELLDQQSRVQGWLDRMTDLRAEATPAVYEKVRTDYEERLEGVNARLGDHRPDLESSVARHRSRVESLEKDRETAGSRLEEAEVRYRVGEYGEEEWGRYREEGEATTLDLERRLEREREALEKVEHVLSKLEAGRPPLGEAPTESIGEGSVHTWVKDWGSGMKRLVDAN